LLVIEAKAGVTPMHSPEINFDQYKRVIKRLIIEAYEQCKRFIEYLASVAEIPLYKMVDGQYVEISKLKQQDFRTILPIGLTVEAFTPFSTMCKEMPEIQPILSKYPFISMSVDDLFVLNRFLPTTGELLHYLEVRQQVAGIPRAMLYDEIEHLGSYIVHNRFDMLLLEQLKKADYIVWDSYGDVVNKHFKGETWKTDRPPQQKYPKELAQILNAMDILRPSGWLEFDAHIRNYAGNYRTVLDKHIAELRESLVHFPTRSFLFTAEPPLRIWLCRNGSEPAYNDIQYQGQVGSVIMNASKILVLQISYNNEYKIVNLECISIGKPPVVQNNYNVILQEAEKQKRCIIKPFGNNAK
jgi:hypothetical protein